MGSLMCIDRSDGVTDRDQTDRSKELDLHTDIVQEKDRIQQRKTENITFFFKPWQPQLHEARPCSEYPGELLLW